MASTSAGSALFKIGIQVETRDTGKDLVDRSKDQFLHNQVGLFIAMPPGISSRFRVSM